MQKFIANGTIVRDSVVGGKNKDIVCATIRVKSDFTMDNFVGLYIPLIKMPAGRQSLYVGDKIKIEGTCSATAYINKDNKPVGQIVCNVQSLDLE